MLKPLYSKNHEIGYLFMLIKQILFCIRLIYFFLSNFLNPIREGCWFIMRPVTCCM